MKKKIPEFAERIKRLRGGRNQVEFAMALGVSQAIVSSWERGRDRPSPASWLMLGMLASGSDKRWFWEEGGDELRKMVAAAEDLLREDREPPREGEIVRVSRAPIPAEGREGRADLLPLPAQFVTKQGSTFFLVFDEESAGYWFAPGDVVVLEAHKGGAQTLKPFVGQVVGAQFTPYTEKEGGEAAPNPPKNLVMGRLLLWRDRQSGPWIAELVPLGGIGGRAMHYLGYYQTARQGLSEEDSEEQAAINMCLLPGWRILGRVIGYFSGGGKFP